MPSWVDGHEKKAFVLGRVGKPVIAGGGVVSRWFLRLL
jgi:hypothetical protein